ncbi:DUF2726 domain-containing protein [Vibrio fortis]|uniref:DUF2726 domain-containing protein n=1 Tax=Vibrio fortis TaxID=212667 RepID=A0A5N3R4A5_9VIBR|nr:DUF2726 domain-containing protein [Vibrio fortis]KAB0289278.1 DUF2726 domain-containing protein [Vibrio fortis]
MDVSILILAAIFFVLALIVKFLKSSLNGSKSPDDSSTKHYQYQPIKKLCTANELSFYQALVIVTKGKYTVFSKVRIADVMAPKKGAYNKSDWWRAFNAIAKKHVDFVLCDPLTLEVKMLIELDDSTHNRQDRKERDKLVDMAAASAGVEIKHFKVRKSYDYFELEKSLFGIEEPSTNEAAQA